jgi:hypothetical protein
MYWFPMLALGLIVLAFCWALYVAYRSWRTLGLKRRIVGLLLLTPHLILIGCVLWSLSLSLSCGRAPQGSSCFNAQFASGVFMVFILPVPAVIGTGLALWVLKS